MEMFRKTKSPPRRTETGFFESTAVREPPKMKRAVRSRAEIGIKKPPRNFRAVSTSLAVKRA